MIFYPSLRYYLLYTSLLIYTIWILKAPFDLGNRGAEVIDSQEVQAIDVLTQNDDFIFDDSSDGSNMDTD